MEYRGYTIEKNSLGKYRAYRLQKKTITVGHLWWKKQAEISIKEWAAERLIYADEYGSFFEPIEFTDIEDLKREIDFKIDGWRDA